MQQMTHKERIDAVLAHSGSITVGQNKPQGTVFTVQFPRATSEETGI